MKSKVLLLLITILFSCSSLIGCGDAQSNTSGNAGDDGTVAIQGDGAGEGNDSTVADADSEETQSRILTFEAKTIDGEVFTSDCFADSKLTMINIWATYCNPCLVEMPDLGEIAASYDKSEFQIIGVISDVMDEVSEEDKEYARELIQETGANYPHLTLNESLYMNLVGGVTAVPTTFFVTQEGEVLGYVTGARAKEDWEALIHDLLEENQ